MERKTRAGVVVGFEIDRACYYDAAAAAEADLTVAVPDFDEKFGFAAARVLGADSRVPAAVETPQEVHIPDCRYMADDTAAETVTEAENKGSVA